MTLSSKQRVTIQYVILVLTCLLLYSNTLRNKYALDDAIVITENEFTKKGTQGVADIFSYDSFTGFFGQEKKLVTGGRYRPLSIASFALEVEWFGLNPAVSHGINLLLYLITVLLIFYFLSHVFFSVSFFSTAFITALLFLVHPVHSEVVANIKGRDELMAFLFGLGSLTLMWFYLQDQKIWKIGLGSVLFFLGLLSKENAVTFIILIPLFFFYFDRGFKIRKMLLPIAALVIPFIVFMSIRYAVLGDATYTSNELMNNPFVEADASEKAGTILLTLGIYLKLLFFPHPLTYDYYPYHIPLTAFTHWIPVLIFVIYAAMMGFGIYSLKSKSKWGYGIWFYLIPLSIVSNILFPIGTFMNERFLYFSSFGFCLIAGFAVESVYERSKQHIALILAISVIVIASGWKTISRNSFWYNDYTLFTNDVNISENSAKGNLTAGGAFYEKAITLDNKTQKEAMLNQSITYLKKSLEIHPLYTDAMLLLGNAYWEKDKNLDSTLFYYNKLHQLSPNHKDVINNLKAIAAQVKDPLKKKRAYQVLAGWVPEDFEVHYLLGNTYGKGLNQLDSAKFHLEKALKIQPNNVNALLDMGVAHGISGDFKSAANYLELAHKIDSTNKQVIMNLGVTYQQLGQPNKAQRYFSMLENQTPTK